MDIEKIDYSKLLLVTEKKGYRFSYNFGKCKIKTPAIHIPFGLEVYLKKEIINVELVNKSNEQNNFIAGIKTLDKLYHQFSDENVKASSELPFVNLPTGFIKEVANFEYMPSVKTSMNGHIVRCHLKPNMSIIKKDADGKITNCLKQDIKKKNCIVELELGNMWIYNSKYGLIWYINSIEILD